MEIHIALSNVAIRAAPRQSASSVGNMKGGDLINLIRIVEEGSSSAICRWHEISTNRFVNHVRNGFFNTRSVAGVEEND